MQITVEITVAPSVEEVWRAWTTPDDIKQWNAAEETHTPEQQRAGWQAILDRFARHVEGRRTR